MKILKPNDLGVFYRFMKLDKKYGVFSYYLTFDLITGKLLEYNKTQDKILSFCDDIQDEGFPKLNAEVLLSASAYSYDFDTKAMQVGVKVGEIEKELIVFGDRKWSFNIPTTPIPFKSQKIEYSDETPPIVEYPDKLVTSKNDKIIPASFTPLPIKFRLKQTPINNYEKYWPYFPNDFDVSYFNMAPKDQQKNGYFEQEEIIIKNMNPDNPLIKSKIPNYNVRCFIQKEDFYEVELHKDTLWLFPDILVGMVIFRGVIEIEDEMFSKINYLYSEIEREKQKSEFYYKLFLKKIEKFPKTKNNINSKPIQTPEFKIAKKSKTLIKQILHKKPSIKLNSLETAINAKSGIGAITFEIENKILQSQNKIDNNLEKTQKILSDMDNKIKNEFNFSNKNNNWADDGFEFVNQSAKSLLISDIYPKDFIQLSLIGINLTIKEDKWGEKEVMLMAGFVYPRFEENILKAVRIDTNDEIILVNGSDKNFPLKIIENKKYPFFVTNSDLEGWMVNYECYDMCNVIVCDNKDKIKEIVKDNEIIVWGYDIDSKKIEIKNDKSLKDEFYDGNLREIFMKYLIPDSNYEEDLGFEEASKIIDNKVSSKIDFIKQTPKLNSMIKNVLKESNIDISKEISQAPINEKKLLDILQNITTPINSFNELGIVKNFDKKVKVIKELMQGYDKKNIESEKKIEEVKEKTEDINIPKWAQEMKDNQETEYVLKSLKGNNKAIYQLNEKDKIIQNEQFIFSLFEGELENIKFINCKFKNMIFKSKIIDCKFINCEIDNCIFKNDISAEFDSILKNNIFEKINIQIKINNVEKNMFVEANIENSEFKNLEYCNFIQCNIKNSKCLENFNKNSFNNSILNNLIIDVKAKNLSFIGSEIQNVKFIGDFNNIRFLKETKLLNSDLSQIYGFKATFFESIVEDSKFIKSNFNNSIMQKSIFKYCDFRKVKFKNARIENSTVQNSLFGGSDFYRASFRGSSFEKVSLIWTNLYNVEMFNVKFKETLLDNANIEKTFLKKEYFEDSK